MALWIVRMGESMLKSKPVRRHFTSVLRRSLSAQSELRGATAEIRTEGGLMFVECEDDDSEAVADALRHTFGVGAVDPATDHEATPDAVGKAALATIGNLPEGTSFAVRCKRHGNKGEWTSQTFAGATGAAILAIAPHLTVNLSNPDWAVRVALFPDKARLLGERIDGPGGLPAGVQGLVLAQLRDEADMLAAWLVMHRGCRIQPEQGASAELLETLSKWDPALADEKWASKLATGPGSTHKPQPWGIVGAELTGAPTTVTGEDGEVVKTPLSHLEPLVGWTAEDIESLRLTVNS